MSNDPELSQEDMELVARITREERLRQYVRRKMEPAPESFLRRILGGTTSFLFDKETLRTILTVAFIPLAVWYVSAQDRDIADARQDVDEVTKLVPSLASSDQSAFLAYVTLQELQKKRPNSGIISALLDAAAYSANAGVRRSIATLNALNVPKAPLNSVNAAPPSSSVNVSTIVSPPIIKPKLVYLQFYGDDDNDTVTALQNALINDGISAPGPENVGNGPGMKRNPQTTNIGVRYFNASDQPAAAYTAKLLEDTLQNIPNSSLPKNTSVVIQNLTERTLKANPGTLEVWLPCSVAEGCK